jgi:serine/threonine-protein kinase
MPSIKDHGQVMATDSMHPLVRRLAQSPLLDPAQRQEVTEQLQAKFPEPKALFTDILRRGWLTVYQIRQLAQGRESDLVLGPYILLDKLGEGGNGQVFKARHQHMKRIVALKVVRPELLTDSDVVNRFHREIEVVSQMSDPHIVHAYDARAIGSTLVLAMEYVDGIDLDRLVKESGPLPVVQACDYIRQAALGLQHAHERGLVHRDIKPANLLVSKVQNPKPKVQCPESQPALLDSGPGTLDSGLVKIMDMGLARLMQPSATSKTRNLTVLGSNTIMLGTPDYQAPEQALDFRGTDIRTDIYSLGCTFYYLLTGKPPFEGTLAEKLLKHQQADPKPVSKCRNDVPPALALILSKMMAKQPVERYQTPGELANDLESLLAGMPKATPENPPDIMPKKAGSTMDLRAEETPGSGLFVALGTLEKAAGEKASQPEQPARSSSARLLLWLEISGGIATLLIFLMCGFLFFLRSPGDVESTTKQPSVAPTSTKQPPQPIFLADMPALDVRVGFGQFGKKGDLGYENKRITIKGVPAGNGLSMHPPTKGASHVTYLLGKKYQTFKAAAAINDDATSHSALTFKVIGDGKRLWQSRGLKDKGDSHSFVVSVDQVDKLELEVHCPGEYGMAHAVWVDPQLVPK